MVQKISINLEQVVHENLKNKCRYYGVSIQHVSEELLRIFSSSNKFDELLNLPKKVDYYE